MKIDRKYSTVDQVIDQLKNASDNGHGDKILTVHDEYYFSKPNDEPTKWSNDEQCDFSEYYVI